MSPIVATRSVSATVAVEMPSSASRVEIGFDDHLRPVERGVGGNRAEHAGRRHLALDLARLVVEQRAVRAHDAEGKLPLAAIVDEVGAQVRDGFHLVEQDAFEHMLRPVALGLVLEVGDDGGAPGLQRARRAGAADHIGVLDLGHLQHQPGDFVRGLARVVEPASRRQFQREDDAAGVLARDEARRQEAHRVDGAGEKHHAGAQRHPAEAKRRAQAAARSRA